jgi:hypothetical protein
MKVTVFGSFLLGASFGAGMMFVCAYSQRPCLLADSIEALCAMGRKRRARSLERQLEREWLTSLGYSKEEVDEVM